jgi:aminopeptidase N
MFLHRRIAVIVTIVLSLALVPVHAQDNTKGADGLGDSLFPQIGNGGYDVQHYTLDLNVDMSAGTVAAKETLTAHSTQDLSAFNLDFEGLDIDALAVNDLDAPFSRTEHELTVTPSAPIQKDQDFTVELEYHGQPGGGWTKYNKGVYVASEPTGASGWYAVNDHPLDKATYTFVVTVPKPYVVAANGVLKDTAEQGDLVTYAWEESKPMASYLAAVNIAEFTLQTDTAPDGTPVRNYFPKDISPDETQKFTRTGEMIKFFSDLYGPYPFEVYGVTVADTELGFALETQTLTLFGRKSTSRRSSGIPPEQVVAHELSHHWFGDSVSLKDWRDIWLNEGFATYSQFLWAEHKGGKQELDNTIRAVYRTALSTERSTKGTTGSPTAEGLFDTDLIYLRGALTLHALRLHVGDDTFFRILRTYADRYRYGNASTADFIAVAGEISGQDLKAFFNGWLYHLEMPDIPEMNIHRADFPNS